MSVSLKFTRMGAIAAAAALAIGFTLALPAAAQADSVLASARASGIVGEQADGYVGIVSGASASADVRARVEQLNIRRRAAYTESATASGAAVNQMAAAVACQIFAGQTPSGGIRAGEHYRAEDGQWRQRTASTPVVMPSFCPPA